MGHKDGRSADGERPKSRSTRLRPTREEITDRYGGDALACGRGKELSTSAGASAGLTAIHTNARVCACAWVRGEIDEEKQLCVRMSEGMLR
jgi:hypothetical protein